jgi:hypothetical protein
MKSYPDMLQMNTHACWHYTMFRLGGVDCMAGGWGRAACSGTAGFVHGAEGTYGCLKAGSQASWHAFSHFTTIAIIIYSISQLCTAVQNIVEKIIKKNIISCTHALLL